MSFELINDGSKASNSDLLRKEGGKGGEDKINPLSYFFLFFFNFLQVKRVLN